MMRTGCLMTLMLLVVTAPAGAAEVPLEPGLRGGQPGSLVLHEPIQSGGPAADTAFVNKSGSPSWQLLADDFTIAQPATVRRAVWWGFYNFDNPPIEETMRFRFYDARPADGLPGNILFEESFLNPSRVATGLLIPVTVSPAEYIYQVDLTTPFQLAANVPYWVEISQIGDIDSHFQWEFAFTDQNDFAFMNPFFPKWRFATSNGDLAFQLLSVPEPASLGLVLIGFFAMTRRGRRKWDRALRNASQSKQEKTRRAANIEGACYAHPYFS